MIDFKIRPHLDVEGITERVGAMLGELGPVAPRAIAGLLSELVPGRFNCYPGLPGDGCHDVAFFVSLERERKRGRLTLKEAFSELNSHFDTKCPGSTKVVVLITDNWDPNTVATWRGTIQRLRQQAQIELLLISGGRAIRMDI